MSNPSHDRNLLFGLQALQNGLITETQLVDAIKLWSFSKEQPLGHIMVTQGCITADLVRRLDAMLQQQLALLDGDAQRGIAALSSVDHVARAIQSVVDDSDVQKSLSPILDDRSTTIDAEATATYGVSDAKRDLSRFQILHEHARGGLGRVSIAIDHELKRKVVVKEIQAEHSGDSGNRERFVREAEITGQLEHPGIVPVYALGSHPDGRPFYAMKFVRGDSLKAAIARYHEPDDLSQQNQNIQFRELLQRFIDVCDAMAYAHSRGVLHRDLKPANIMLGKFGETLVVDWGLAKAGQGSEPKTQDPDASVLQTADLSGDSETVAGQTLGTPAYMSPEQAEGKLNRLGPASDVYSLGATLYHILTGQPAFLAIDDSPIIPRVINGQFPKPTSVNTATDRSLEAVCLKSMERRQEDRYQSPTELAKEIERWLADEPVEARQQTLTEKTWRWLRKNRATAFAGAAVMLVAFVSAGAIALISAANNQRLTAMNSDLRQSEEQQREARMEAEAATANAKKHLKSSAYTLVGLDTAALDTLIPDIGDFELNIPQGANKASVYQLLTIASGRNLPSLNPDAVSAFQAGMELLMNRQSVQAYPMLKQAADLEPSIRIMRFAASLAAINTKNYAAAEQAARSLVEDFPNDAELSTHLASILQMQSFAPGLEPEAQAALLGEAREWLKKSIKLSPRAIEARVLMAELAEKGTVEELKAAEIELRELVKISSDPFHRSALVVNLELQGKLTEALQEVLPLLRLETPQPSFLKRGADLLRKNGQLGKAVVEYERFETAKQGTSSYDDDVIHLNNWGVTLVQLRRFSEALQRFEELEKQSPDLAGNPVLLVNKGRALLGDNQSTKAVELAEKARLVSADPVGLPEVVDSLLFMICAQEYQQAATLIKQVEFASANAPDRFATLYVALTEILSEVQADASLKASLPALGGLPHPVEGDWDYYFLDRWLAQQSDVDRVKLSPIFEQLKSAVPSRVGVPFKK